MTSSSCCKVYCTNSTHRPRSYSRKGACEAFLDDHPSPTSQVTACSNLWKGNLMLRNTAVLEETGLAVQTYFMNTLDSMPNYFKRWHKVLFGWLDVKCSQVSTLMGWRKEWCFRRTDELGLYIGYSFMLHLVTFASSKLFVSSGDVALGIVLRLF